MEKDFDYTLFRKFFISVLWRASISQLEEYSNIDLGPYENIALNILKNNDIIYYIYILLIVNLIIVNKCSPVNNKNISLSHLTL